MQYLTYAHFFCSIACLGLALVVLSRNPKARDNRLCFAFLMCFVIWSGAMAFVHNAFVPRSVAITAENIGSIGWIFFSGQFLVFVLVFIGANRMARSPAVLTAIYFPAVLLLYKQWFGGGLVHSHMHQPFGWIGIWDQSLWPYGYYAYYSICVIVAFILLYRDAMKTGQAMKKRQVRVLFFTGSLSMILGSVANVILRMAGIYGFPPVGDMLIVVWAAGLAYSITRFRFLSITPTIAADRIIGAMNDLLILLDMQGVIVSVNQAVCNLLGFARNEIEGRSLTDVLTVETDRNRILDRIVQTNTLTDFEISLKTRNGGQLPVSVSTSVFHEIGIVCVGRDITLRKKQTESLEQSKLELEKQVAERTGELSRTNEDLRNEIAERRNAEEKLMDSEERFRILFEYAPDGFYLSDLSGNFVDGNREAERIIGYGKDEMIGKNFLKLKLLSASQIPRAATLLTRNLLGKPTGPDEFELMRKDGSRIIIEITTFPVKIRDRRLVLGIARDMGQRRRDDSEKAKLEEQLAQAQKMEAIGRLAGGIAHDFNNMLGGIMGYNDLILERLGDNTPALSKYASRVKDISKQAAELTAGLLAFARKGKFQMTAVDMRQVVEDVIDLLKRTIDKRIAIVSRFETRTTTVLGDRAQLQNALLNLGVNARDAMPQGGTLTFETSLIEIGDVLAKTFPYAVSPGTYVRLSVSDTGIGMDDVTKSRVFEPFFTTKEQGKGTGLGLASVYGTVKGHNGFIELASEMGKGTTFQICLPFNGQALPQPVQETPGKTKYTGRILVVDDEDFYRDMTTDILQEIGYSTFTCANGREAVAYYRDHAREIDLVLLDIIMPEMGGGDCFREMKRINRNVRALICSGYPSEEEANALLAEGAVGFLQKPYSMAVLSKAIRDALGG